jgi:hypothetical protein
MLVSFAVQVSALRVIGQEAAANIVGATTDTKGASVPFARISVTNDGTGLERKTTSDKEGNFVLPELPPGTYTLTAEEADFPRVRITGLQ